MPLDMKALLKYRWVQTEEMAGSPADVAAGVCFALSLKWAGRHKGNRNESSEDRVKAITASKPDLIALQQRYQATPGGIADKEAGFWKEFGFTAGNYDTHNVIPNNETSAAEAIAAMIIQAQKARHYTGLSWKNANGGHQMVCYHSNGKFGFFSHMYFYDPNGGEFVIPHGDIAEFFLEYWFRMRKAAKLMSLKNITWVPLIAT